MIILNNVIYCDNDVIKKLNEIVKIIKDFDNNNLLNN